MKLIHLWSSFLKTISKLTPITKIKGVGPKVAEKLTKLGIVSAQDLLFHLPYRYEDRTRIVPIGSLRIGDHAVIQGTIELTEIKFGRKRMLVCRVRDGSALLVLRFFHFTQSQKTNLARGKTIRCFGEVRRSGSHLEMTHPEYSILSAEQEQADLTEAVEETLTPVYPVTEGLHQISLRNMVNNAFDLLNAGALILDDYLPTVLLDKYSFSNLKEALRFVHYPPPDVSLSDLQDNQHPMKQRLIFEELLTHILSLRQLRARVKERPACIIKSPQGKTNTFKNNLPFELTNAQKKVVADIQDDLIKPFPMQRLVQGDVGSGKTVVAAIAALQVIESGYQVAIMAPTEILAEQHYTNFKSWFEPLGLQVAWLSGKLKAAPRRESMSLIESAKARIVIGTHALFQDEVEFKNLALVIIDEQHRFGVHQRLALRNKGVSNEHGEQRAPHQLIMTATPIPRTLSMTAYADLDCSIIDELPPGRTPVDTVVLPDSRRVEIIERIIKACQQGRQVYWVCTLIEESEVLQCQAAENTYKELSKAFPDLNIGLVHGRMKPEQKEQVMSAFKGAELQLLIATTVIEVGVDVPNASLMVIENAERLGLSQLHQLRGRVGRGQQASACVLMYRAPLSQNARTRLDTMRQTNDGFKIAQKDLEIRGPGEVLGTRQTGLQLLKIADLQRDAALIPKASKAAEELERKHPENIAPLIQRWLGDASRYADV
ncbi:ATP-dependent DNA helicase RecG [hydrothermal vent metagenome]|uniref:ATP-dependent DNA helicase RecG n=1 Tax=hydrothermal vent metagenome TaxID=652676 RepID=A0A3B0ZSR2_9ZZZZ